MTDLTALTLAEALDGLAANQGSIALPGYTHMQQAMPSSVASSNSRLASASNR